MAMDTQKFTHWHLDRDDEGIVWLTFDRAGASVNSLSAEVLEELNSVFDELKSWAMKGIVVRSGKKTGFIAGADVKEFTGLKEEKDALELIERGQAAITRFAHLPVPTVALITGFCLGGGLELALACRYRIALDSPETRLGLPEILLGIHPGFGGTVRLTSLIGAPKAMDLMLTGRTVDARTAKKMGIVDFAVPARQLENAVRGLLRKPPALHQPSPLAKALTFGPARALLARYLRNEAAKKAAPEHYPAPFNLIGVWEKGGGNPALMYREEAASVARLIIGRTSKNLVRVFTLRDRMRGLGKSIHFKPRYIHVIGGGTMGGDIAAWCALQGYTVTIQDLDNGRLANVVKRANDLFRKKLKVPREREAALDRLIPDREGAAISSADVVIEAIFEDVGAKRDLFRSIEPRLKPDAVLATNTSSIPLEELGQALSRPGRLIGLHFFNPVAKMELVEVVSSPATEAEMHERGVSFVQGMKKLPLPVKSSPGFLVNRILMPYLLEAVVLEGEGVPATEIDRAAVKFGMPMGPILLADTVGLDVCLSVARIFAVVFNTEVPKRLEDLVAAGRLGKKSGAGFYNYEKGNPIPTTAASSSHLPEDLTDRIMLRMVNEAVACLREGVAEDADLIDAGVIFGTGFAPFRGGPLNYARQAGAPMLREKLVDLEKRYGNRFTPDAGWNGL